MSNREFERDPAGFTVVIPHGAVMPLPLCCPVCHTALRSRDDERSATDYGCCRACEVEWVHADKTAWSAGKRPSADDIAKAISVRPGIVIRISHS
jgi:hypothetical protein